MLFKENDIVTFQKYVSVSFTFDVNNTFNGLMEAEDDYLKPVLGDDLFETMQEQAAADEVDEQYVNLLSLCRKVVAPLSILLGISTRHVKIGNGGLKKTVSDGSENVYGWEYQEVKEELRDKVAKALDKLWEELFLNSEDYEWSDSSDIKTIFKTGTDFNKHYSLHQPHRVFPLLKPIIKKVEELFIWDSIGEDFLNELKELDADPDDKEEKAQDLLKSAIAHFTMYKAITELSVKKTDYGLTVLLNDASDKPYKGERAAPDNLLTLTRDEALKDGSKYLKKLKIFLRNNASDALFTTFKNSPYYSPQPSERPDYNSGRKGIVRL